MLKPELPLRRASSGLDGDTEIEIVSTAKRCEILSVLQSEYEQCPLKPSIPPQIIEGFQFRDNADFSKSCQFPEVSVTLRKYKIKIWKTYLAHVDKILQHIEGAVPSGAYVSQELFKGKNEHLPILVLEPSTCVPY